MHVIYFSLRIVIWFLSRQAPIVQDNTSIQDVTPADASLHDVQPIVWHVLHRPYNHAHISIKSV